VASDVAGAAGYQNRTWQDVFTMPQSHRRTVLEAAQRLWRFRTKSRSHL